MTSSLLLAIFFILHGSSAAKSNFLVTGTGITTECDLTFISAPESSKNGSFNSPILTNEQRHSRQCIYTFHAAENERVQVTFTKFNLRGTQPECIHEYVDIYTELDEPNQELITSPFGGRYCGRTFPKKRVSLHQSLVFGFYTDQASADEDIFQGTFEFIDSSPFVAGTPTPHQVCSFTTYSEQKREGQFRSPTYPGVYPKNLNCQYRFLGRKGQRVRLEFMDFDLFFGGSHCPFDFIKVYDGGSTEEPLIGTYCGQQRNLVIYSSTEELFVQFSTLQRTADSQNRGFSGWFEFSERFVNLGFIGKNDAEHIRGTECDQKILSRKESNGTVYSPNYPFLYHTNIVCKYFIYGLQDAQNLEKVKLDFEKFEIAATDPNDCNDAYVRVYLSGEALEEPDHIFCGSDAPSPLTSEGPIMVLIFSSGTSQGQGFKGRYLFQTDYKVPGTPEPPSCRFTYRSKSLKSGNFNSPRYPSNYPSGSYCEYEFMGLPGEQVKLVFKHFRLKADLAPTGYNDYCTEDWVEVYQIFPSGREYKFGRYCSSTAPGPIISDVNVSMMRVILNTDDVGVANGFIANYEFIPASTQLQDFGHNVNNQKKGIVTSAGNNAYGIIKMQIFIACQDTHCLEITSSDDFYTLKEYIESAEKVPAEEQILYCNGRPLDDEELIEGNLNAGETVNVCLRVRGGKVHGSLARAGKVKGQTPKVDKAEKKKKRTGRAKRRMQYNKRFVSVVATFGRKRGPNANVPA
ncbi:Cubilin [Halotydeus destructor]|nr:Cubilin [Halotydeus destructor]